MKVSNQKTIKDLFNKLYFGARPQRMLYLGIRSEQYPTDNWVMQEIITEIRPDFIIETGTGEGGTALFYATILEKVNEKARVITVDFHPPHPRVPRFKTWRERVDFIKGDCISSRTVNRIAKQVKGHKVVVTLDSYHSKRHVLQELKLYSPFVSLNSYIVVQDTHLGGHPNRHPEHHHYIKREGGPWGAVEEFLKTNRDFEIDHSREGHLITQNPSGFLKRVR